MKQDWFPDWSKESVVIAASGPSQNKTDIEAFRGTHKVVVINDTYQLAPWADVLYACDKRWWDTKGPAPEAFTGMRIIGIDEHPGCHTIHVDRTRNLIFSGDAVGSGGNSGFQAINLMVMWGVKNIVLLGFDYKDPGNHWFGRHPQGMYQSRPSTIKWWITCMDKAAGILRRKGVEVINCTRDTDLMCFKRMTVEEYLDSVGALERRT
ncbi:MAG TPA: hypothetical protein V6D20_25305 [Candidatus Obscuribacterales bacterium]